MLLQTLVLSFMADTKNLDKGIKEAESSVDDFINAMKGAEDQSKNLNKGISEIKDDKGINELESGVDELNDAMKDAEDQAKKLNKEIKEVKNDKGIKGAKSGTDDLTDAMKKAEDQSKKASDTFKDFLKKAVGWMAVAATVGKTLSMAVQRAGEIDALDTLSLQLGTSITKTDALARSIVALGGSTEQAQADLATLGDALKEKGQKPLEGMIQLSNRLAGMSYDRAARELKNYGITEKSTIELMRKGGPEIERMIKHQEKNGAITVEAAEKAKQFNESLTRLKQMSSDAANGFVQALMPALTAVADFLAKAGKWASENKPFVVGFFAAAAGIITVAFLPAMLSAAAATIAATWPFIAIGVAIAAAAALFALIYDDIMNFIEGGDSMIGMVLNKFPVIGEVVNFVADLIKLAFSSILQVGETLSAGISSIADSVVGVFEWLWNKIKSFIDLIGGAVEKVKGALSWAKEKLGFGDDADVTVSTMSKAQQEIVAMADNPNANMTTGAIRNASTGNQVEQNLAIGEIKIETQATDAQGMANDTRSELQTQLQKMQSDNATAITR